MSLKGRTSLLLSTREGYSYKNGTHTTLASKDESEKELVLKKLMVYTSLMIYPYHPALKRQSILKVFLI